MTTILIVIAVILALITALALIGVKAKKREEKLINEWNEEALKTFKQAQANKKLKRQSTPRVKAIKNPSKT